MATSPKVDETTRSEALAQQQHQGTAATPATPAACNSKREKETTATAAD